MGQLISSAILVTFVGSALVYGAQGTSATAIDGCTESLELQYIESEEPVPSDTTGCAMISSEIRRGMVAGN